MRDQLVENKMIEKKINSKTTHAEKTMLISSKKRLLPKQRLISPPLKKDFEILKLPFFLLH